MLSHVSQRFGDFLFGYDEDISKKVILVSFLLCYFDGLLGTTFIILLLV